MEFLLPGNKVNMICCFHAIIVLLLSPRESYLLPSPKFELYPHAIQVTGVFRLTTAVVVAQTS